MNSISVWSTEESLPTISYVVDANDRAIYYIFSFHLQYR